MIRRTAAWMHDVLKVWLHGPASSAVVLSRGREEALESPLRAGQTHQRAEIGVERLCASRDMRITSRDAEFVIRSCFVQTDELESSIGIQLNKAAVGGAGGKSA